MSPTLRLGFKPGMAEFSACSAGLTAPATERLVEGISADCGPGLPEVLAIRKNPEEHAACALRRTLDLGGWMALNASVRAEGSADNLGFNLIELLVVIAIIGVLPALSRSKVETKKGTDSRTPKPVKRKTLTTEPGPNNADVSWLWERATAHRN